ncbi:MAG: septal ring lytic transglycosylase RlpA family protein [Gammaproteobacteria bacterium]|nr:septal ring lytic transglycosylase RlpA family protein [Gammaproteobacteria bacterium]NIR84223.1 septal ring lytic transglycosylase RlpA family protein [Gammaproteobacteria bacterium]NIR89693.1 septal ring lytic transglycosylase RlpA family protein [Gammaproteobacteria bacterium]NIU05381.1 septal ring lytic transglycosylase RlpA family protein [Gammaproteobacteria bacterium]NIV52327.1 septal ring lytic transglycosylase RlpA family protein [Gammaproteobacteria bacterium]
MGWRDFGLRGPAGGAALLVAMLWLMAGCGTAPGGRIASLPVPDVAAIPDAVPRPEPRSRHGNPRSYVVKGKRYYTLPTARGYVERGIASWYGPKFHGRRTSSGERYDMYAMTAAHRTLPLPTYVRVTNLENGRQAVLRVNDRGPFHHNRIIDLSYAAAAKLGVARNGTGLVEVRALDASSPPAPRQVYARLSSPAAETPTLYLQVGAFAEADNAHRMRARLYSLIDGVVRIQEGRSAGRTVYRVQVGPLGGAEEADRLARTLADTGLGDVRIIVE